MPSSLASLVAATPSGRARPLLLDSDDYAARVVRQGSPVPWTDVASLTGYVAQVCSLLGPDAVWIDIGSLYAAHAGSSPVLREAMAARSRTGYALRTMLGDEQVLDPVRTTLQTVADLTRRRLVLDVPSPARWLARAHALAGTPLEAVDEDAADGASMYLAEWLGRLGRLPVALTLLDARAEDGDPPVGTPEHLVAYTPIVNVASHFDWTVALLRDTVAQSGAVESGAVETADGEPTVGVLPETYWSEGGDPPEAQVLLGWVPPTATPERVLDRLARL